MFRNKEYIYCIYKERSFCKAAEKLHISQPALSAMVKRIEGQLGMPVFNRATSPVSLTQFGAEYIKSIETVSAIEEHLQNTACELKTFQSGQLSISAHNLSVDYFIPEMIASFQKKYPKIKLDVIGTNTIRSKQMLDSGEIDLFFSTKPLDEREYKKVPIAREQLVLIVPKDFETNQAFKSFSLTRKKLKNIFNDSVAGVDLASFKEAPFILSNSGNHLRSCTDTLFREAQFDPDIMMEVEESGIGTNFAKYGIGATISSSLLVERVNFRQHFYVYKLNSSYAARTIYVYYRAGAYVTPAMERFLGLAETYYAAYQKRSS